MRIKGSLAGLVKFQMSIEFMKLNSIVVTYPYLYHISMKHSRSYKNSSDLLHLIWHRDTYNIPRGDACQKDCVQSLVLWLIHLHLCTIQTVKCHVKFLHPRGKGSKCPKNVSRSFFTWRTSVHMPPASKKCWIRPKWCSKS